MAEDQAPPAAAPPPDPPSGPAPPKRGRKTKLTRETHEKIIEAIRGGNYIETAAAFAGISKVTLYKWLRKGARSKGGPLRDFTRDVRAALAAAEVRDIALIGKAATTNWQAAAWRRERKNPERWGTDRKAARLRRQILRTDLARKRWELEQLRAGRSTNHQTVDHNVTAAARVVILPATEVDRAPTAAPAEPGDPGEPPSGDPESGAGDYLESEPGSADEVP